MDLKRVKDDDDYFLKLVENFEKLLDERRCRVRQEMMKCRIEMEAEFKLKMKNFAFQSIMNLRQKVNESNRKLKDICSENNRRISQLEIQKYPIDAIFTENCRSDMRGKEGGTLLKKETNLRDEKMKINNEVTRNCHSSFAMESKDNERYESLCSPESSNEEMNYNVRKLEKANNVMKKIKRDSSEKQEIENGQESIIDPIFLERNTMDEFWNQWSDSDDVTSCFESNSNSTETNSHLFNLIEKDNNDIIANQLEGNNDNFKMNNNIEIIEDVHCEGAEQDNAITKDGIGHFEFVDETVRPTGTTTTTIRENECQDKEIENPLLQISLFNSSAESAQSETEGSLPLRDEELLNMQSQMVTNLETIFNEESITDVGTETTPEKTNQSDESFNVILELKDKEIEESNIHNTNNLSTPNNFTFGFSPRSPSKYKKFKSDREIRKNIRKETVSEVSLLRRKERDGKPLDLSGSHIDDLWLMMSSGETQFVEETDSGENEIDNRNTSISIYEENNDEEDNDEEGCNDKEKMKDGKEAEDKFTVVKQTEVKKKHKSRIPVKIREKESK